MRVGRETAPAAPRRCVTVSLRFTTLRIEIKQSLSGDRFEQPSFIANEDVMIAGQQRQLCERVLGARHHRLQTDQAAFQFVLRDAGLQQFGQSTHASDFLKVKIRQAKNFLHGLDETDAA